MESPRELFETKKYYLPGFNIAIYLVRTPDVREPKDMWFVITPLCDDLGVAADRQRSKIKSDLRFDGFWDELPVKFDDVGYRKSTCVRIAKIGTFFNQINPKKVLPRFAGRLMEVQQEAEIAAGKAVLGDDAEIVFPNATDDATRPTPTALSAPVLIETHTFRAEMHIHCLSCGAPHCIVIDGGKVHFALVEETP